MTWIESSLRRRAAASLLLLSASLGLAACGDRDEAQKGGGTSAEPAQSAEEELARTSIAERKLEYYGGAMYEEKIEGLEDVAHIYWDTKSGPVAFQQLIFYLLDEAGDHPERAMKELKLFNRRRPESEELLTAAMVMSNSLTKNLQRLENDPKREVRERLLPEANRLWCEIADRICALPQFAHRYDLQMARGDAYMYSGEYRKAVDAWARVESFKQPARPLQRLAALIKRADMWRDKLGDPKRSLEVYHEVRTLGENLDVDEGVWKYVLEAIETLEAQVGKD